MEIFISRLCPVNDRTRFWHSAALCPLSFHGGKPAHTLWNGVKENLILQFEWWGKPGPGHYQLSDLLLVLGFHKAIPKLSVLHKVVISWDHPVKAARWALSWKGLKFRLCYTPVLRAPGNLEVVPYFLGCIWSIPAISICSGVMVQCQTWIQRDVVPVWRILCTSLSHHQAEAVSQHMQKQKDLGGGQIGIFQRNFHHFPVFFFSGLNLSVGSTPGSVISQSLQQ